MWPYSHTPFANPATHVHRYVCGDTAVVDDWLHVAPFVHGLLSHSSTSTSQLPRFVFRSLPALVAVVHLPAELTSLSATSHSVSYSSITSLYAHMPLAYPATHAQRYA